MKALFIIACTAVAAQTIAYDLSESPLRSEVFALITADGGIRSKIAAMPAEKRNAMRDYVRLQYARDEDKSYELARILLCLGDEAIYQEILKKRDYGALQDTLDPHAFELIAPEMSRDDPPRWNAMGIPIYPDSALAQQAIGTMLRRMPESPQQVKAWMDTFVNADVSQQELQQIFRSWWTTNEAAWRRRDFTALKAGPDMSHRNIPKMRAEKRANEAGTAIEGASLPVRRPIQPAPSATVPSQNSEPFGIPWLHFALVGTLVLCVAFGIREWLHTRNARK